MFSSISAILFPKYFAAYENWSNIYILHGKYDYLKKMPKKMVEWPRHLKLADLLTVVEKDFKEVMEVESIKIFLAGDYAIGSHEAARDFYIMNPENLDDESGETLPKESPLPKFLKDQSGLIISTELKKELLNPETDEKIKTVFHDTLGEMEKISARVIIPIFYLNLHLKDLVGFIALSGWAAKPREPEIDAADRELFADVSVAVASSFMNALVNRRMEIIDEKKSNYLSTTLDDLKKADEEKALIEDDLEKSKDRARNFADLSSKFATKIQVLGESMEDLEAIMRYSPSAVLTIREGVIRTANKQARHYLVELGQNVEGKNFEEVFTNQFKNTAQIVADTKKVVSSGEACRTFETEWINNDLKIPVEVKILPLKDRFAVGRVNGALIEIANISEAKERQRLLHIKDKFETFRDMLEGLRHELNNAMNILNLYSSTIKKTRGEVLKDENFRETFCNSISAVVKFVGELIQNLADSHTILRPEEIVEIDLNHYFEEAVNNFKDRLAKSKITVNKKFDSVPEIMANAEQIKMISCEIIKNSIEAIEEYDTQRAAGKVPQTGGVISISTRMNESGEVEVSVADNGVGIEETMLDKVFNHFYTTKVHSVAHQETGTGLGLKKVYNTVTQHGGSLKIQSKIGQGTTVVVSFKLRPAADVKGSKKNV